MKKSIITLLILALYITAQGGIIDINGVGRTVDTLVYKQVGPGVTYCYAHLVDGPEDFHVLTIDMQNPYTSMETFLGKNCVEGSEKVTDACNRHTSEGHDAYCGVNSDFFIISTTHELPYGSPIGGSIHNGELQVAPQDGWWWGFAAIDSLKHCYIDYMEFNGYVRRADKSSFGFKRSNIPLRPHEMTFYNKYSGPTTRGYNNNITPDETERTEVVIVPKAGEKWGINKTTKVVVRRKVTNIGGGEIISEEESVLSGIGSAKTFLDAINVGDELEVEMDLRTTDNLRMNVQHLAGGNAVLMKNGILTDRNTNDSYNSMVYPRTGIATSADKRYMYLFVGDGKMVGGSVGITTADMCGILKTIGASDVAGLDGGGSAEMVVNHRIANKPADGTERSVGNGWMVISTAPTDSTIASLRFLDHKIEVPRFASYTPHILGYNQYGVLINHDVKDFTLRCKQNVGTTFNSTFTAGSNQIKDSLTVILGTIEYTAPIEITNSEIKLLHDSVIIDQDVNYPIEVISGTGEKAMLVDPSKFSWKIEDNEVATISNDGKLNGIKNGTTQISFLLENITDTMDIISEINPTTKEVENFMNIEENWKLKTASKKWNSRIEKNRILFDYSDARAPYIKLEGNFRLYSLPDSISFNFKNSVALNKMMFSFGLSNNKKPIIVEKSDGLEKDKNNSITLKTSEIVGEKFNVANYPLYIKYINFMINGGNTTKGANSIEMHNITLHYGNIETSVEITEKQELIIYPNPASDILHIILNKEQEEVKIFDIEGKLVARKTIYREGTIEISNLEKGIYLVSTKSSITKLIIK